MPAIPACASDPSKLGLERVVEIDPTGGPSFGYGRESVLQDHEVVLTFDDGPLRPFTRPVLKALADHCTRATFFMVGKMAVADPAMVKEVLAAGHTVGSHTWSHKNLKPLGLLKGRQEFELGLSAVTQAAGQPIAPFFRFPYLSDSRAVRNYIQSRDTATFFIDIDSKDFQTRNSNEVFERTMRQLMAQRKGIILMHDIQPSTAGMIRRLLDTLHQKGFKVVHFVPKGRATTVADYDRSAAAQLAANAGRSHSGNWQHDHAHDGGVGEHDVVIPGKVVPGAQPSAQTAKTVAQPAQSASTIKTGSVTPSEGEVLPWAPKVQGANADAAAAKKAPAPATTPRRQARKQPEELPWQMNIFQY